MNSSSITVEAVLPQRQRRESAAQSGERFAEYIAPRRSGILEDGEPNKLSWTVCSRKLVAFSLSAVTRRSGVTADLSARRRAARCGTNAASLFEDHFACPLNSWLLICSSSRRFKQVVNLVTP